MPTDALAPCSATKPLWQQPPAVVAGRGFQLEGQSRNQGSALAAGAILDDLATIVDRL